MYFILYSGLGVTECGDSILDRYEFSASTSFEVGYNFLAMGIFFSAFIILGFIGLLASAKKK